MNSSPVKAGLIIFPLFLLEEIAILPMTAKADCVYNQQLLSCDYRDRLCVFSIELQMIHSKKFLIIIVKGEQKFVFVFLTGLVQKSKTNCIFHLVGYIVRFGVLDT